jgi:hypothetical protein
MPIAQWEQNQTGGAGGSIDTDIAFVRGGVPAPDPWQTQQPRNIPGTPLPPIEAAQLNQEYFEAVQEVAPEREATACDVIDRMDADAVLLRRVLVERNSVWGRLSGFFQNNPMGQSIARMVGGGAVLGALRVGMAAIGVGGAVAGGISGAVGGGFFAWLRARDREESAATWMRELGIQGDDQNSYERIEEMNPGQLYMVLGVLRSAIMEGRVRGTQESRLSLALKYRQIRNRLQELNQQSNDLNETGNPVFDSIQAAMAANNNEFREISRSAEAQYRTAYEQIRQMKGRRALMSGLKGAAIGLAAGATLGYLMDPNNVDTSSSQPDAVASTTNDDPVQRMLDAQRLAEQNPNLAENINSHNAEMDMYYKVMDQGAPIPDNDQMRETITQLARLNEAGGHIEGMDPQALSDFSNMMKTNPNLTDIFNMANHNNLDFTAAMGNNQEFANYLLQNKDVFNQMTPEIQRFVLSHPTFSEGIFEAAKTGFKLSFDPISPATATIFGRIFAAISVAAGAGGFTYAHIQQRRIDRDLSAANQNGWLAGQMRDAGRGYTEQLAQRAERIRQETIATLQNNRVRLPARLYPVVNARTRGNNNVDYGRTFDITGIDDRGDVTFAVNGRDRILAARSQNPIRPNYNGLPINVFRDFIDANTGRLQDDIQLLYASPDGASARRQEEANNRTEVLRQLTGAEVQFTAGFLRNDPFHQYPADLRGRANRFVIERIEGDRLVFRRNPGETFDRMPEVYVDELLTPEGRLSTPNPVRLLRLANEVNAPEQFNAARYETLLRMNLQGTIRQTQVGGTIVTNFEITSGATAAVLDTALGQNNRLVQITSNANRFGQIYDGMPMSATLNAVRADGQNRPVFEASLNFGYSGNNYAPDRSFTNRNERLAYLNTIAAANPTGSDRLGFVIDSPRLWCVYQGATGTGNNVSYTLDVYDILPDGTVASRATGASFARDVFANTNFSVFTRN